MPDVQIHYNGENGDSTAVALYVDGQLKAIGPPAEVQSTAIRMFGYRQIYSSQFLLGQETYAGAAKTLSELKSYLETKNAAEAEALRAEAAELIRRADELQGRA